MTTTPEGPLAEEPEARPTSPEEAVLQEAESVLAEADPAAESSMDVLDSARRMLLVHAHPDDETIGNGVTMAKYAAEGAHVTLVTCTLGEEGEVLVPELEHLAADQDDQLGRHRIGELATAMEALGVRDHRFLGGPGRFRDSGMMGLPTNDRPDTFWQADLDEAAGLLVEVIREIRPQVVVTYDENGGYGHPDHIQAHRVAMRGVELAADPAHGPGAPWQVSKVYWNAMPDSLMRDGIRRLQGGRRHVVRRLGRRRRDAELRGARRAHHHGRRGDGPRRGQAGGDARARHPDHGGRAVLRACPTTWATRCGDSSTTGWSGARPARSVTPTAARPTCSPGPAEADVRAGSPSVTGGAGEGAERVTATSQPGEPGLRGVPAPRARARLSTDARPPDQVIGTPAPGADAPSG